ncbi:MAG: GNAT family N-acetyltransferase [Desulfobacterota bacterium]|nr:GNAT family N-acetyltransferase [Thermodesulfobacteriota bacterium]
MTRLTLRQFSRHAACYHASVAACSGIDPFCCRTDWIIPFYRSFTPGAPLLLWQHDTSFVLFAATTAPDGTPLITPLEAMWGFACPLIGPVAPQMFEEELLRGREPMLVSRHILVCGLPEDGRLLGRLATTLRLRYMPWHGVPTKRCIALLGDGVDGFLQRRSSSFRRNLRQALRRTIAAGISFERIDIILRPQIPAVYRRILAIEARSWKGVSGTGVDRPPMRTFYRLILERIAPAGRLRLIIASHDGKDVGYIYGGVINGYYRGLQFSFDQRYAHLSLGNVLQYQMISWLCEERAVWYDLGAAMPYKETWADREMRTHNLVLVRR